MAKLEKVTAKDVQAAEAALKEGRLALERAKEAFYEGTGEWSAVKDQEAVLEFAEAQLEKLGRDKAKYDEQVRQAGLSKLRAEIDAFSLASGDEFLKLYEQVEAAAEAFAEAFKTRNDKLDDWSRRMKDLGVPAMNPATQLVPAASEQGLGWVDAFGDLDLQAGERKFRRVYSGRFLSSLLAGLAVSKGPKWTTYFNDDSPSSDLVLMKRVVREIDHELPGIPENAIFWRTRDGGLLYTDEAHAFSAEVQDRDGLERITREEALNG